MQAPNLDTPLPRSLIEQGPAQPDELALGLAVNQRGQPCLGDGTAVQGLFALGLGRLPDIDLVSEIVSQAFMAAGLVGERLYPKGKIG